MFRNVISKAMPKIYKEMLLAWVDKDITYNMDNYQTICSNPIPDNRKLGNTHNIHVSKDNTYLVRDMWNVGTTAYKTGLVVQPAAGHSIAK